MTRRSALGLALLVAMAGCQSTTTPPATLDAAHDTCASCRMVVSEQRLASQVVAPYEEPRFFDDLGCLARYLSEHPAQPSGARVYVADHRTRDWVPAEQAIYSSVPSITAPMGSHVVAHASVQSRDDDRSTPGGSPVPVQELFGGHFPNGGPR
jgi:copper chaperone NosL